MSKKDNEIARLTAALAEAEARANVAEAEVAHLKTKLDAERVKREELEAFVRRLPEIAELSDQCLAMVCDMKDIPQAVKDAMSQTLVAVKDSFTTLSKERVIKRLLKKGSEKVGKQPQTLKELEPKLTNAKEAVDKAKRTLKRRTEQLQKVIAAADAAAKEAAKDKGAEASSSPLTDAAAAIANTPDPETQEFPKGDFDGRQVPDEKVKATEKSNNCSEPDQTCPYCGRVHGIISGRLHAAPLRTLSDFFANVASFVERVSQHNYCPACNKAFYTSTGDDVPSLPGRQMGQWLMVKAAKLYCVGIPLDKAQRLLFSSQSRLGNDTLGNNLHDWALGTCKPLLDSLTNNVLGEQHTMLMDETTFSVLQSKGQGICEVPDADDQRQKDYIAVQCSTFYERHRCFRFIYIGSRAAEKINDALKDVHPQVLVTDGYGPYAAYCQGEGRPVAQNCCAHLRREIIDALAIPALNKHLFETEPEKAVMKAKALCDSGSEAFYLSIVLEAFSKIYGNEASLIREEGETDEHFLERVKESRNKYARPLMDHIDTIMCGLAEKMTQQTRTGAYVSIDKTRQANAAVVYYMNRRKNFRVFLDDPAVPPDSNAVEQAVRPITVLRKACDFKQSQERMNSLCILMSLYETARANGITDFDQWLHDYSRAFFIYRANRTLTRKVRDCASLDAALNPKLMAFDSDAGDGFDFTRYYPWNYKK